MTYCRICGTQAPDGAEVCSVRCRRLLVAQRKRGYQRKKKRERTEAVRPLVCEVCGARLRHPGKRCAKHRRDGRHVGRGDEADKRD